MSVVPDTVIEGFEIVRGHVAQEWIDVNGHMNVANYLEAFDSAVVTLRERLGVDDDYISRGRSTFAVECHMTYQRELTLDDPYLITTQILGYSRTGLHQFNRMYHAEALYLASTAESMTLHVDLGERKVVPWPDDVVARLDSIVREQGRMPRPRQAGRQIRLKNPLFLTEVSRT
jgi:acyl-CoA thioester hydrolase